MSQSGKSNECQFAKPKITLKKPKLKPKPKPQDPKPTFNLYELKLAFRAECKSDIDKVLVEFEKRTEEEIPEPRDQGYIGEFHVKQAELEPGVFFPDFDVPIIAFRVWVVENGPITPQAKMSQLIKRFLDSIEEIPDTHVIRGSIDYQRRYDGDREERLQINPETNLLQDIQDYIQKLQ